MRLNSKLAFAAIFLTLAVSIAANVYLYQEQCSRFALFSSFQKQAVDLRDQMSDLQSEKADLQSQLNELSHVKEAPKLVTVLGARDMRFNYRGQEIRLYISGEVWNAGGTAAQNCRLHVTLYQGENMAKSTLIELGTINPESCVKVDSNIYYSGSALTNWTITPEYQ